MQSAIAHTRRESISTVKGVVIFVVALGFILSTNTANLIETRGDNGEFCYLVGDLYYT